MTEADVLRALRDVNVQHILSFLVVAEVGGFRSAAEQLHISQSALSVQVRQLEAALQVQLLHRTTRSVSLTPQGRAARIALGRVCGDLRRVVAELRDEAALQRGLLAIVALPSMAATILPKLVRNFTAKHPGIEVRLRDTDSRSALAMIRRGEVDLGIMSRPPSADALHFTPLFMDEYLVVSPGAGRRPPGKRVPLESLRGRALVLNPRGVDLRESLEVLFERAGIALRPAQEMIANSSLVALVAEGLGTTILPRAALSGLRLSGCQVAPLHPPAAREVGGVTLPERSAGPAVRAFLALAGELRSGEMASSRMPTATA
ncbi:LysR family transcriptional regulator [Pseudoroseomonas wenyumeiae]|uniref:LysR family transcriptional regulator n=1 Tax=Teichococcus wenyumeiae TaxID=2478470 RepID=A0A3A9JC64_9PROT|nr:LysR substrate-binding domain-containing protein [Pseudoroseomonas wenyumeiae]RKK02155.1 LysR family transcriptional regulator [Pseudoroseomonas wenyumeiae]RMI15275.1 LysR family transcriptional regulator [Pseudoroseomonas wenyumeiae]